MPNNDDGRDGWYVVHRRSAWDGLRERRLFVPPEHPDALHGNLRERDGN
jgi:hypothetical protein